MQDDKQLRNFAGLKYHENPDLIRNGNLVMKTWALVFGLLCFFGIHWKIKKHLILVRSYYNLITLNETLHMDGVVFSYLLGGQHSLVYTLGILRTILIENIFFKCLIPLCLLLQSKKRLGTLWLENNIRRLDFYMTTPSFITRPIFSEFEIRKNIPKPLSPVHLILL